MNLLRASLRLFLMVALGRASADVAGTAPAQAELQRRIETDALEKPLFYDEYRVDIDMIPPKYLIPDNVSWSEILNPKRMTSSAAYDLYRGTFEEQEVVIKILRNQSLKVSRSGAPREMEKEIKVLMRLNHPNIIRMLGHGTDCTRVCAFHCYQTIKPYWFSMIRLQTLSFYHT